ncbi:hypothetical protein L5D93_25840 [Paenibacillus thiaminolyticus]|nr:hypothetical protein [Paenibacillus thiaminolyticus]
MRKRGIAFKIFGITSALLIISALILYLTLFFLLPNYYYKYKEANVSSKVQSLIESLYAVNAEEAADLLLQFEFANNVRVVLRDPAGEAAYPGSPGSMDPAYLDELMRGPKPPGADPSVWTVRSGLEGTAARMAAGRTLFRLRRRCGSPIRQGTISCPSTLPFSRSMKHPRSF